MPRPPPSGPHHEIGRQLLKLRQIGSDLEGHPTPRLPFVDVATGSLGQGICAAIGTALNARRIKSDYRTYVLLGDGESAEGSVWEAAAVAACDRLDNLCGITDVNALGQSRPTMWQHDMEQFARRLMEHPAVAVAVTRAQLQQGHPRNELHRMLANGFMSQRCGDIVYALRPGYIEAEGTTSGRGTTHGSGWNYDTHVPVIWYGQGVRPGEVLERTAIADIAPTVAAIVGMALPDASVGRVVEGSVKR